MELSSKRKQAEETHDEERKRTEKKLTKQKKKALSKAFIYNSETYSNDGQALEFPCKGHPLDLWFRYLKCWSSNQDILFPKHSQN